MYLVMAQGVNLHGPMSIRRDSETAILDAKKFAAEDRDCYHHYYVYEVDYGIIANPQEYDPIDGMPFIYRCRQEGDRFSSCGYQVIDSIQTIPKKAE